MRRRLRVRFFLLKKVAPPPFYGQYVRMLFAKKGGENFVKVVKLIALCAFVAASFGLTACAKKEKTVEVVVVKTK